MRLGDDFSERSRDNGINKREAGRLGDLDLGRRRRHRSQPSPVSRPWLELDARDSHPPPSPHPFAHSARLDSQGARRRRLHPAKLTLTHAHSLAVLIGGAAVIESRSHTRRARHRGCSPLRRRRRRLCLPAQHQIAIDALGDHPHTARQSNAPEPNAALRGTPKNDEFFNCNNAFHC